MSTAGCGPQNQTKTTPPTTKKHPNSIHISFNIYNQVLFNDFQLRFILKLSLHDKHFTKSGKEAIRVTSLSKVKIQQSRDQIYFHSPSQ